MSMLVHGMALALIALVITSGIVVVLRLVGWWKPLTALVEIGVTTLARGFRRRVGPVGRGARVAWSNKAALMSRVKTAYERTLDRLERSAFPPMIAYAINPITILFDLLLIPLLIVYRDQVVLVLVLNSYLNAFSVAISSMVALLQKRAEQKQDAIAAQHVALGDSLNARHDAHDDALDEARAGIERILAALRQQAASAPPAESPASSVSGQ